MATVVVIGEEALVSAFGLAGAVVVPAEGPDAVRAAWSALGPDVGLVLLTAAAAHALEELPSGVDSPLTAVMSR